MTNKCNTFRIDYVLLSLNFTFSRSLLTVCVPDRDVLAEK